MRPAWTMVACALLAACNVPIERFARADAADDAAAEHDAAVDAPPDTPASVFLPLHLSRSALLDGAPDLEFSGTVPINTSDLTLGGFSYAFFVQRGGVAVLFAKTLKFDATVKITGARPLIVVASGAITVSGRIDLGAAGATAGPGAVESGVGVGGAGTTHLFPPPIDVRASSGGGGGGYGTAGGHGGARGDTMTTPGAPGMTYSLQPSDALVGGARGGPGGCSTGCTGGGGGGGALQLSSATSITVTAAGVITVAGGGGAGGGGAPSGGGGAGGGGEILLEAPAIVVAGTLAANGGGGGGAGGNGGVSVPLGIPGEDGHANATPAVGGAGGMPMGIDSPGGAGAAGIAGSFVDAQNGGGGSTEGGGAGGGAGRIWLRYRATTPPDRTGATISPPAGLDDTL